MQSTEQSSSRTDAPQVAAVTTLRPRPTPPRQRLFARPIPHDLDMGWGDDANKKAIPGVPAPRRSTDKPLTPAPRPASDQGYAVAHLPRRQPHIPTAGYGQHSYLTAFGEPDPAA